MGQIILYIILFGTGIFSFISPWIGVVFSYLIAILVPQNIWWWNFHDIRPVFWVMIPTVIGFAIKLLNGAYRTNNIRNWRNAFLFILWIFFSLSYFIGPYANLPSIYRFHDSSYIFSLVNNIFILYFIGCLCIDDENKLKWLGMPIIIGTIYLTYWANDQYLSGKQLGRIMGPTGLSGQGIYVDENAFAMLFVTGLPFLYFYSLLISRRVLRAALWIIIPFGWHAVFLTGSRGGLVGLGASILLVAMRSRKKAVGLLIILLFLAAYAWQAGGLMKSRADTISEYETESAASTRLEAWEAALSMIGRHTLFGVGLSGFGPAFPEHSENRPREAHNTFFQISAESGIVAGIMYVLVVISCFKKLWRNGNELRNAKQYSTKHFLYLMNEATLSSLAGLITCSLFLSLQVYEIFYYLCLITNSILSQVQNYNYRNNNVIPEET
jgi:putative inorganic carbon (hco3(-)) transporter